MGDISLKMKIPDCCLRFYNLSSDLHDKFDHLKSIIRQKSKKKSCSYMSLGYLWKISAQLDQYNFSYERDSTNDSVSDSLLCDNYFVKIEAYFGKVLNMKVVEGWLIELL